MAIAATQPSSVRTEIKVCRLAVSSRRTGLDEGRQPLHRELSPALSASIVAAEVSVALAMEPRAHDNYLMRFRFTAGCVFRPSASDSLRSTPR